MKHFQTSLILLISAASAAVAQTTETPEQNQKDKEKPYIEVMGVAEKEIIPDEIYIAIVIQERIEDRLTITVEKQLADLKAALTGIGVNPEDLLASDADAHYVRINLEKNVAVFKTEYRLKVHDAPTVEKVFKKLAELNIENASISRVAHSKMEDFQREMRIAAMKSAKNKADYMLEAIGEKTGKPMVVREITAGYSNDYDTRIDTDALYAFDITNIEGHEDAYAYLMTTGDNPGRYVQYQKLNVKSVVYVKFEIK